MMEYICLTIQIVFLLITIFVPYGNPYLVNVEKVYRKHLFYSITVQLLCIIANVVSIFIIKEIMLYITILHICLAGLIGLIFEFIAKKQYYQELKNVIKQKQLEKLSPVEIRRYLLEKLELSYTINDIEKCLLKINK